MHIPLSSLVAGEHCGDGKILNLRVFSVSWTLVQSYCYFLNERTENYENNAADFDRNCVSVPPSAKARDRSRIVLLVGPNWDPLRIRDSPSAIITSLNWSRK